MHQLKDLAVIITAQIHDANNPFGFETLVVTIWRDCSMRIRFPSGSKMEVDPRWDLDTTIQLAIANLQDGAEGAQELKFRVHRVPRGLATEQEIMAWLRTLPGIQLEAWSPPTMGVQTNS